MERPDISEKGGLKGGVPQRSDRRLFMQLMVFSQCRETRPLIEQVAAAPLDAVVYESLNDPRGVALLTLSEDPSTFIDVVRPLLNRGVFADLTLEPNYTMFGRTYSLGYEPDLEDAILHRPRRTVLNPEWSWGVWYPLRRNGAFAASRRRSSASFSRSTGRSACRSGPRITRTTSGSPVTGWTATTMTS
jgi:chlorite dismutase